MLTVFAQEHADYIGVKVEGPVKVGITVIESQGSVEVCGRWQRVGAIADLNDELFADRARAGGHFA